MRTIILVYNLQFLYKFLAQHLGNYQAILHIKSDWSMNWAKFAISVLDLYWYHTGTALVCSICASVNVPRLDMHKYWVSFWYWYGTPSTGWYASVLHTMKLEPCPNHSFTWNIEPCVNQINKTKDNSYFQRQVGVFWLNCSHVWTGDN